MTDGTRTSAIPAPRVEADPAERWLPVVGYEGRYEVSNLGRVKSLGGTTPLGRNFAGRLLKIGTQGGKTSLPYPRVCLSVDAVHRTVNVHTLVAEAFIGARPDGCVVRHVDGDHANSALSNLRYGTPAENVADTLRHGNNVAASKTHCKWGHEFTSENTYVIPSTGHRSCRRCIANRKAARAGAGRGGARELRAAALP